MMTLLVCLLGAFRLGVDQRVAPDSLARYLTAGPRPAAIEGVLVSDPHAPAFNRRIRTAWLKINSIRQGDRWLPASGKLKLKWPRWDDSLGYGDRLRAYGTIRAGHTPTPKPGTGYTSQQALSITVPGTKSGTKNENRYQGWDETRWLWLRGAEGVLTVSAREGIVQLQAASGLYSRYRKSIAALRWKLIQLGRSLVSPEARVYLEGLLLGEGQGIPKSLKELFRKTGTVHVLVVSGLHVGLIGLICNLLLSVVCIPRGLRYCLLAGILVVYCTLTGMRLPIVRATIMGVILCLNLALGRAHSALNALGLAALVILVLQPRAIWDPSFQLSFAAVLGILLVGPHIFKSTPQIGTRYQNQKSVPGTEICTKILQPVPGAWAKIQRRIAQALAVSCAAWVAVLPLIAWHFKTVTLIAPLANLVVVPWASLLIATGFLVYGVGFVSPVLAKPFAASFELLAWGLTRLVNWIADLPGAAWQW